MVSAFSVLSAAHSASAGDAPWANLGRPAAVEEIAAWDIDVKPDGTGLPRGRGSVSEGQEIYEAQCAACHGTFGESNQYIQLAGGIGSLKGDAPERTTGSKLNYATTLWDYINRAMPFQAPKSLTADEVYALTAYMLHLNEILADDATLDERSILQVKMPNREGFTTRHGLMRRDGEPDVQNTVCMSDCAKEATITSVLPDHARNAHGNLAEQSRPLGPYRGADTTRPAPVGPLAAARAARPEATAAQTDPASPANLARRFTCTACHGIDRKSVGPSFREVTEKYRGRVDARAVLMRKVRSGGSGTWGTIPMPAQPQPSDEELARIVDWVMAGAKE